MSRKKNVRKLLERLEVLGEKAYPIGFMEKKEDKQEQVVNLLKD